MSTFLKDSCYNQATTYAPFIEFHLDEHHRRAFNASQLIEFSLGPNAGAEEDAKQPPQKLCLMFSTADVVVLGWRLGLVADYLRDNRLSAIGILPQRNADVESKTAFVSAITITEISKNPNSNDSNETPLAKH
jgi:hypothetical protein